MDTLFTSKEIVPSLLMLKKEGHKYRYKQDRHIEHVGYSGDVITDTPSKPQKRLLKLNPHVTANNRHHGFPTSQMTHTPKDLVTPVYIHMYIDICVYTCITMCSMT